MSRIILTKNKKYLKVYFVWKLADENWGNLIFQKQWTDIRLILRKGDDMRIIKWGFMLLLAFGLGVAAVGTAAAWGHSPSKKVLKKVDNHIPGQPLRRLARKI